MKKSLFLMLLILSHGCGAQKAAPAAAPVAASPVPPSVPSLPVDDNGCQLGQTVGFDDPKDDSGDVKALMATKCASCHPGYEDYDVARSVGNGAVERVNLASADVKRMPKFPAKELSVAEKTLLSDWKAGGFQEKPSCKTADNATRLNFSDIETFLTADLARISSSSQQKNTRYLIMTNRKNQNVGEDFAIYVKGMNKGINFLSSASNIVPASPIDPGESIYRIDLRNYGLTANDWNTVVQKDKYKFDSSTQAGLQIRNLTGTQFPWLHGENFAFISLGDPAVYNVLNKVSATNAEHIAKFKADQVQAFADLEARQMCFNTSPISENKNRMLMRLPADGNTNAFWQTFDPNDVFAQAKNCFEFPMIQVGAKKFQFDASETIAFKDNGMMDFGLWAAADGSRQTEAPANVVVNNASPFSSIIKNGLDCMRCHNSGLLPAVDQFLPSALANSQSFPNGDFDLIRELYKSDITNSALFKNDNRQFEKGLAELGIDASEADPTNYWLDRYRADQNVEDVANFVFMTPEEFCINLQASPQGSAQIGNLCSKQPGTITLVQWQATFPIIKKDFRLGLDPL